MFEIIARGVILNNGKILLCKRKDRDYSFLPGGHVEFGETTEAALAREVNEELGVSLKSAKFIGALENIFIQNGIKRHEINLVFEVLLDRMTGKSAEDHLEFYFADTKKLANEDLLPAALKKILIEYLS
jgi:ADP-ribose pyrophosphatase YjhB (NUDIX family)